MSQITQEAVLSALRRAKAPTTANAIAERLGASERAVRRHLAALHAEGKVARDFAYTGTPAVGRYHYTLVRSA
jgi:predicted ArsR family transcriptional regulator